MNLNLNPELAKDRRFSTVGEMVAAALDAGTASVVTVEVHAGCTCEQAVTVEHAGPGGYDFGGETVVYMIDGRYYDRPGIPLAAFDSATVARHVDTLLGHRDDASIYGNTDRAACGPVREWASVELYSLAMI
jgi:hypothetical protein